MAEINNILSRLEKIFKAIKLKYVIVGGIAVIHYGLVKSKLLIICLKNGKLINLNLYYYIRENNLKYNSIKNCFS